MGIYGKILQETRHHTQRITAVQQTSQTRSDEQSSNGNHPRPNKYKAHKAILMVLTVYIILYFPQGVAFICILVNYSSWVFLLVRISGFLMYLNSAVNMLIYAAYSKDFNRAFKQLLCCDGCRKRGTASTNGTNHGGNDTNIFI